jgi:hypothetical protein
VLELVADVAVVHWLLGSAAGSPEPVAAVHGQRLESLLTRLVDTPVRGFVYEAAGAVPDAVLAEGARLVEGAGERWRIRFEIVSEGPEDHDAWLAAMISATDAVLATDG